MINSGEIIIYQTEDGLTNIDVKIVDDTIWLSQQQMAELFKTSRSNVVEHIKHIYEESELDEESTCRNFRQVRYATSIDYDPNSNESMKFFKIVQNKLHYAAHGHTAAEVIYDRADSQKPFMGLRTFSGETPVKKDISVAKNYLDERELKILNNLVSGFFDFAEIQAIEKAEVEYRKYQVVTLSSVEQAYMNTIRELEKEVKRKKE